MKKISYSEDWSITNEYNEFDYDSIDERLGVSGKDNSDGSRLLSDFVGFDCDLFDNEQIEYLKDFFVWYRKENVKNLLSFLLKPCDKVKNRAGAMSERTRNALMMKVFCRVVLLHKIINDPEDIGWRELPKKYGVSNHSLYDVRKEIVEELSKFDKNISYSICNNRHLNKDK